MRTVSFREGKNIFKKANTSPPSWCGKQLQARPKRTNWLVNWKKAGKNKAVYDPLTINQHVFVQIPNSDLAEVYKSWLICNQALIDIYQFKPTQGDELRPRQSVRVSPGSMGLNMATIIFSLQNPQLRWNKPTDSIQYFSTTDGKLNHRRLG